MKISLLQILFIFSVNLFFQSDEKEFTNYVNQCIYSFRNINNEKYKSIRGIEIEFATNFKISSYKIFFDKSTVTLNEKEYYYLLKKLKCKSHKSYIKNLHETLEYDKTANLKCKIKYIEPVP